MIRGAHLTVSAWCAIAIGARQARQRVAERQFSCSQIRHSNRGPCNRYFLRLRPVFWILGKVAWRLVFLGDFERRHGKRQSETDVVPPCEWVLPALVVASRLVLKIRVERAAADALERLGHVERGLRSRAQRRGRPLPNVADQLVHSADALAVGTLVDIHRARAVRAPEVGATDLERLAPGITPLGNPAGSRFDGQSGTFWNLGEAIQYKGAVDVALRSGSLGVSGALASVPISRSGGTAPANSDGDIQLRVLLATFRTREMDGPHQIIEVGLGLGQWANYSGTDAITADERKARNALALTIGYGFGFTLGDRVALFVIQDVSTLWGSGEGLTAGQSRQVQQYTTRLGLRYRVSGRR